MPLEIKNKLRIQSEITEDELFTTQLTENDLRFIPLQWAGEMNS